MTEADAIIELLRDVNNPRLTNASAKRVLRACKTLNVNPAGVVRVLGWLEYVRTDGTAFQPDRMPCLRGLPSISDAA